MSDNKRPKRRSVKAKIRRGVARGVVSILRMPEVQTELWEIMHRPARRHAAQDIQSRLYLQATEETAAYVKKHMPGDTCFDDRFELLETALRRVSVPGLYLEFGVYRGKSINFIARHVAGQTVHGFDSLKGLPKDWIPGRGKGEFSMDGQLPEVEDNVQLHVGWFDQTLPKFAKEHAGPVAFMNIDCDIYASTKTVFDTLGDRIVPGTVIRFDEYFNYPGWQDHEYRAFQEFVQARKLGYRYIGYSRRDYSVAVIIEDPR
ncbi:MAG: TylF/MycF/NovP-related O-methyltransferase [Gammaproteobacteria bacterium]